MLCFQTGLASSTIQELITDVERAIRLQMQVIPCSGVVIGSDGREFVIVYPRRRNRSHWT